MGLVMNGVEAVRLIREQVMEHIIMRKQNQIDWLRRPGRAQRGRTDFRHYHRAGPR